ncbi:MAG: glycosyltransferase family 87 protein [Candidatus Omnitrophota bacterium]
MTSKRNLILILIAVVVFSGLLARYLDRVPKRHYCDFRVYYKAGGDILQGKDIYLRDKEEVTPYKYSPFFAFVFAPLSMLPIKGAAAVFFAINFILTILLFILSWKLLNHPPVFKPLSDRGRLLVYGLVLLCSMRYIFLVWDSGQVNVLMCFLVVAGLFFVSRNKDMMAGALFAAAILIKYTPAIFLPYFLVNKKPKVVLWTIAFVAIFLALPSVMVGVSKEVSYLSSWLPSIIGTSLDTQSYLDHKNQSLFSMILRFFSVTKYNVHILSLSFHQALLVGYGLALLLYLVAFIPTKRGLRNSVIDYALLIICTALFNPNGWLFNFVSLLLPYMLLICYAFMAKTKDRYVLLSLIAAFVVPNLMCKDFVGKNLETFGQVYSFTTIGALILFAALIKLKFFTKATTKLDFKQAG